MGLMMFVLVAMVIAYTLHDTQTPSTPVLIHFQQIRKQKSSFTLQSFNNVLKRSALLFSFHFS